MNYSIGPSFKAEIPKETAEIQNKEQSTTDVNSGVAEELKTLKNDLAKIKENEAQITAKDEYVNRTLKAAGTGAGVNTVLGLVTGNGVSLSNTAKGAVSWAGMTNLMDAWAQHKVDKKAGKDDDEITKSILKTAKTGAIVGSITLPVIVGAYTRNVISSLKTTGNKLGIAICLLGTAALGAATTAYTFVGYKSLFNAGSYSIDKMTGKNNPNNTVEAANEKMANLEEKIATIENGLAENTKK